MDGFDTSVKLETSFARLLERSSRLSIRMQEAHPNRPQAWHLGDGGDGDGDGNGSNPKRMERSLAA